MVCLKMENLLLCVFHDVATARVKYISNILLDHTINGKFQPSSLKLHLKKKVSSRQSLTLLNHYYVIPISMRNG